VILLLGLSIFLLLRNRDANATLTVGGIPRDYIVHLPPAYDESTALPVVLVLHGGGSSGRRIARFTEFNKVADREGFIAVYPEGYKHSWADGRGVTDAEQSNIDDVVFISALLDELESTYLVDSDRVYAVGISNGGFFTQALVCNLSDRIQAGAVVAATLSVNLHAVCDPGSPTSMLFINGTADPLVPYEGGSVINNRGDILSAEETVNWWSEVNGCPADPTVESSQDEVDDGTAIHTEIYGGCADGTEVWFITVEGGGHTWPGHPEIPANDFVGTVSQEFDANEVIWAFFSAFPAE